MTITISYFAILREQRGLASEQIQITEGTPESVYLHFQAKYQFTLGPRYVKAAINEEFVPMDRELKDGDHLVFIPPVAGG
jgi:sulfur-carrier protein